MDQQNLDIQIKDMYYKQCWLPRTYV